LTANADEASDKEAMVAWGQRYESEVLPLMRDFCLECHNGAEAEAVFDLAKFSRGDEATEKPDIWDEVGKRVRKREMPPEGSPQPNDEQRGVLNRWFDSRPKRDLCSQMATDDTKAWYRGYVMSRRLTRTEYLNAIRDATGVTVPATLEIASDGSGGEGFDTNGETLFTSPIHIEQYVYVASSVVETMITGERRDAALRQRVVWPDEHTDAASAAKQTIATFARHAWRRPIEEHEVNSLVALFDASMNDSINDYTPPGDQYAGAISQPLVAILVSSHFLFVVERDRDLGGVQRLSPHELAMRLSLLIWSSIPDDELLDAADANTLDTDEQVIAQTKRMLADSRSRAIGENFGLQWLALSNFMTSTRPDAELYPQFDSRLAGDMREEAIRLVSGIFTEDRPLSDLIDAPYAILNGPLAAHYGIELPADAPWQTVPIVDRKRGGVLTLGATLVTASYPRRTSPVLRGRWLLEEIMGDRVPPPPPNVPALEEVVSDRPTSLRERLELHRTNPDCASCHNRMDPLGFGLENFDAIGRWRDDDSGVAIDASGKLPSGESFVGPAELKQIMMNRFGDFERHFVKKFVGFALGRELNEFDQCVIDRCVERLGQNDHRSSIVIQSIVTSYPFQHRYFPN